MNIQILVCLGMLFSAGEGVDEGRTALKELAHKHGELKSLTASYTQERTTALMRKPLVSKGQLFFRKEPGCVVFRAQGKKGTVIRIDEKFYEVYRPRKNKLERFDVASQDWPKALFNTFSHRLDELEENFDIAGSELAAGIRTIHLTPKKRDGAKAQKIRTMTLSIRVDDHLLTRIAYTDDQGDKVQITLGTITLDPELANREFEIQAAPGTRTIVHKQ